MVIFMEKEKLNVIVETSARHVHLSAGHLAVLFGEGATLSFKRDLSQPGQFISVERVRIEGPKNAMDNVAILGPVRPATQVEISLTDARALGLTVPVRESGNIAGTPGCKIVGPCGSIEITEGVIAAKRHIHTTPDEAKQYGLSDKQIVTVTVSGERALTFDEVVVRVSDKFRTRMHIDVDENNAAALSGDVTGIVSVK